MISVDRAIKIIQCYGAYPLAWPDHERKDMQQLLLDSKSLSDMQKEALTLDKFMRFPEQKEQELFEWESVVLCDQIITNLPKQELEIESVRIKILDKLRVVRKAYVETMQPILLVASVVLVIIMLLSGSFVDNKKEVTPLSLADYMVLYVDDRLNEEIEMVEELEVLAFLEPQVLEESY